MPQDPLAHPGSSATWTSVVDRCACLAGFFLLPCGGEKRRGAEKRGAALVGRAAIPSLFRERVRGPPNQFQLESGIFAGQAQRSSWKGLLAVLSYYRGRSPESRASLAVNQAPAHTESTVRRDPWSFVWVSVYRIICVRGSLCGRERDGWKSPVEGEKEGRWWRTRKREREGSNRWLGDRWLTKRT